ncbi:MAG TPA: hypothetical protein VF134_05595 [Candidatus Dormibacteraeota bacterium]
MLDDVADYLVLGPIAVVVVLVLIGLAWSLRGRLAAVWVRPRRGPRVSR